MTSLDEPLAAVSDGSSMDDYSALLLQTMSLELLRGTSNRPHREFEEFCALALRSYRVGTGQGFPSPEEIAKHPATPVLTKFLLLALGRYYLTASTHALTKTTERYRELAAAFGVRSDEAKRNCALDDPLVQSACLDAGADAYLAAIGDVRPVPPEMRAKAFRKALSAAHLKLKTGSHGVLKEPSASARRQQRERLASLLRSHGYRE